MKDKAGSISLTQKEYDAARPGFVAEFKAIPPTHPSPASDNIEHSLQFAVMMRSRLCIGLYHDGSRPELVRAGPRVRYRRRPGHPRRLGRVGIQFPGADDPDPVIFPILHRIDHCRYDPAYKSEVLDFSVSPDEWAWISVGHAPNCSPQENGSGIASSSMKSRPFWPRTWRSSRASSCATE